MWSYPLSPIRNEQPWKRKFAEASHLPNKMGNSLKGHIKRIQISWGRLFFLKLRDDIHIKGNTHMLNVKHVLKWCAALELWMSIP